MSLRAGAIKAWKTIFDITKPLKSTTLLFRVKLQNHQSFHTVFTSETILRKIDSSFILLLYEK